MSFMNEKDFNPFDFSKGNPDTDNTEMDYERECEEICSVMDDILEETDGEFLTPERISGIMRAVRRMNEDTFAFVRKEFPEVSNIRFEVSYLH